MKKPPPFELTEAVHTTALAPPGMNPVPATSLHIPNSGHFGFEPAVGRILNTLRTTTKTSEQEYQIRLSQLPQTIEQELAATRLEGSTHPLPPAEAIVRELGVRNRLLARKTADFHHKTALANSFYGVDPIGRPLQEFYPRALTMEKPVPANGIALKAWLASYRAAYEARLLSQSIQMLNQQQVNVLNWLAAVQANDQARMAAEQEARRVAAELAHINEQAAIRAREQARLAALAETQRLATEQARIAAEAAARQVAAEQAQLAALAETLRQAELLRIEAERQAQEKQQADLAVQHVYPASGATAVSSPVFSFASTAVILAPETSAAILTALRSALQVVTAAGAATLGSVLIGFAALLTPSRLGNGERFTMSVPLAELSSESTQSLRAIADRQGSLDLPVGIGYRPISSGAEVFVITADEFDIHPGVPVRHATFDAQNNVYRLSLPDSPTTTLTWTPAITPGNSSSEQPIVQVDTAVYSGAPIVPVEGRLDLHPTLVEGWDRFITVFPDDSGIAPLYVVFSSPYEGAAVKGEHSGRDFNPEQTGGPTMNLEWNPATASQEGVDLVKLHTSRFPSSDANKVMIDRLERVLKGELDMTDTDKRYYTHEIRELERFRALGYNDSEVPDENSSIWNNVHTATLEDYKLKDDETLLYTAEALAAAEEQDKHYYQRLLKEMWQ